MWSWLYPLNYCVCNSVFVLIVSIVHIRLSNCQTKPTIIGNLAFRQVQTSQGNKLSYLLVQAQEVEDNYR